MTTTDTLKDIEKLESDLWEAADNLRANSKLTSSDYFMPVLGVIFLRHAANRFDAAHQLIEADRASGKMPKRKVRPADYIARRSLCTDGLSVAISIALGLSDRCVEHLPLRCTRVHSSQVTIPNMAP